VIARLAAAARRVEDYTAGHGRAVAVLLILASTWGRIPGTVIVDVPVPLAIGAFIAVIAAAIALLGVEIYKVNVFAEDWDKTVDDADRGARAADALTELGRTVQALATEVNRLAARRPTPAPRTDTRPAAAVLADQADEWRTRFTFSENGRRP
jgi:hypothetical protein